MAETISHIKIGNQEHPIDAVTVNGLTFTSEEKTRWNDKQDALTYDSRPTQDSNNMVKSGGLYTVLHQNEIVVAAALNDLNDRVIDLENVEIPDVSNFITKSVNDLTNYYLKTETYNKMEVDTLVGAILQFHYEIAESTSAVSSPESNVLYLIGPTGSGSDQYEEYVYPDSSAGWTKIGDTTIDLTGYVTTSALNSMLSSYVTTSALSTALTSYVTTSVLNTTLASYLTSESDPIFSASAAASITAADISAWNAKQDALVFDSVPTVSSSNLVNSSGIYDYVTEIELVTAAALNDLNDRMIDVETSVSNISETDPVFMSSVASTITAANVSSWNSALHSVMFNGVSASVSNGVASISAEFGDYVITLPSDCYPGSTETLPSGTYAAALSAFNSGRRVIIKGNANDGYMLYAEMLFNVTNDDGWPGLYFYPIDHDSNWDGQTYEFHVSNDDTITMVETDTLHIRNITVNGVSTSISNGTATISISLSSIPDDSTHRTVTDAQISAWNAKQNALVFDSIPTQNSDNLVKSGALYSVITDIEYIYSTALNDLNDRAIETNEVIDDISETINDLNDRVSNIKGNLEIIDVGSVNTYNIVSTSQSVPSGTYTQALSAYDAGKSIILRMSNGDVTYDYFLDMYSTGNNLYFINLHDNKRLILQSGDYLMYWNDVVSLTFDSIPTYNSDNLVKSGVLYSIFEENEYVVSTALNDLNTRVSAIIGLPSVSASDNGKIVQVVNGSWALVTPMNVYSGTSAPDNQNGNNGDIYIQTS